MTILVTGSAGFIGFHLSRRLLARGEDVVGLDSLNAYYDPKLKAARLALLEASSNYRHAKLDLADRDGMAALFRDIAPVLADARLFRAAIGEFAEICRAAKAQKIAGIDARGFLFGATVAYELGLGFVPVRKKGKLPFHTITQSYDLEYGSSEVQIHTDAFEKG